MSKRLGAFPGFLLTVLGLATTPALAAPASDGPRPHAEARLSVYVPRLDGAQSLWGFFERVGEKSAILRPSGWQAELHPLLWLDLRRPESLTSAGVDPAGSYTWSLMDEARFACARLSDVAAFEARVGQRLEVLGEKFERKGKVRFVGAREKPDPASKAPRRLLAGYALKGNIACAFMGTSDGESLAKEAERRVGAPSPLGASVLKAYPGAAAYLLGPRFAAALDSVAKPEGLKVRLRTSAWPLPDIERPGTHPFAGIAPSGLLFLRGTLAAASLRGSVRDLVGVVGRVCTGCDPKALAQVTEQLVPKLTGDFVLRVDRADLKGPLRSLDARYFALKHSLWVKLKPDSDIGGLLASVGTPEASGAGRSLATRYGAVRFGVKDGGVFLANDAAALAGLLDAPNTGAGPAANAVEATVDPKAVARSLRQISLLDVMATRELAPLFGAGAELGPLLSASERMTAHLNGEADGSHSLEALWTLSAP
jgi:hypothetical protein